MKKLFAKVTAAISAAAMLAVPAINAFPANAAVVNYTREIWEDYKGFYYYDEVLVGDANGDGRVTLADATAILNYIGDRDHHHVDKNAADTNGDGGITPTDALIIQRVINGNTFFEREQEYFKYYISQNKYNANGTYRIFLDGNKYSAVLLGDINNDGVIDEEDIDSFNDAMNSSAYVGIFDNDSDNNSLRARRAGDINNNGYYDQEDLDLIGGVVNKDHINFDYLND